MAVTQSICLGCKQKYTGWATSNICPDCGCVLEPITDTNKSDELPITCEFPLDEFFYKVKAYKIGNDIIITFSNDEMGYFTISVRGAGIHISTVG